MTRLLRFYIKEQKWYADIPEYIGAGGTEEECEMVAGADEWLDIISEIHNVTVKISDTHPLQEKLVLHEVLEVGAVYIAQTYEGEAVNREMWFCPVTLFLFDKYPDIIYYEIVK